MSERTTTEPSPDPRVEKSHRVVKLAVLEELADVGYGGFRIESVARRSGVAKSTIYRHWPGKLALVVDALETLNVQPTQATGGSLNTARERVEELLVHLATAMTASPVAACTPALIEAAEHDPDLAAIHHDYNAARRRGLVEAIADGVDRGEFDAGLDLETAAVALAGAIVYSRFMTAEPFAPDRVAALVDLVLPAAR